MKRLELYIEGKLEAVENLHKFKPGDDKWSNDGDRYHRSYIKLARYGRASGKPYELYLICPAKKWGPGTVIPPAVDNRRRCFNPPISDLFCTPL